MAIINKVGACVALASVLLASGSAHAADQDITGKKLLLKSNPKMVLLSKDALAIPGANGSPSDPRCIGDGGSGSGGSVKLDDGTNSVTLNMPCANWSADSAGTLYKYKDTTGTPKVGKIKAGLLKVVSPGMGGFPVPNGAAIVNVEVTVGTDKYCMTFSGSGDGDKFLVKDAAAGTCAPPPCEATTGGFCWYLGASGASCDDTCAGMGKSCSSAGTIGFAGSGGTLAQCQAVLAAIAPTTPAPFDVPGPGYPVGCVTSCANFPICSAYLGLRYPDSATQCAAAPDPQDRRACACQ